MKQSKLDALLDPKEIEKRNKVFHKMSKKQQRLAIAKDVLAQLRAKKYQARPGTYADSEVMNVIDANTYGNFDLQQCLLSKNPECEVCALGASFVSLSRLGDKVDWSLSQAPHSSLDPIFGKKQVQLIEAAFEGWEPDRDEEGNWITDPYTGATEATYNFCNKYELDANKRLAAIFKNIIKNDGVFIP
jgi:hypothetical protein